jgi:hypothetical protein
MKRTAVHEIAKQIIWEAHARIAQDGEPFQNENAAIHAVTLDIEQELMVRMGANNAGTGSI